MVTSSAVTTIMRSCLLPRVKHIRLLSSPTSLLDEALSSASTNINSSLTSSSVAGVVFVTSIAGFFVRLLFVVIVSPLRIVVVLMSTGRMCSPLLANRAYVSTSHEPDETTLN